MCLSASHQIKTRAPLSAQCPLNSIPYHEYVSLSERDNRLPPVQFNGDFGDPIGTCVAVKEFPIGPACPKAQQRVFLFGQEVLTQYASELSKQRQQKEQKEQSEASADKRRSGMEQYNEGSRISQPTTAADVYTSRNRSSTLSGFRVPSVVARSSTFPLSSLFSPKINESNAHHIEGTHEIAALASLFTLPFSGQRSLIADRNEEPLVRHLRVGRRTLSRCRRGRRSNKKKSERCGEKV